MARGGTIDEAERLLGEAEDALDAGEAELALERSLEGEQEARGAGPPADALLPDLLLTRAAALNQLGRNREALAVADALLRGSPRDDAAMLERAFALWELLRVEEAVAQARLLLEGRGRKDESTQAWAHHLLGLAAERQGDAAEAGRRFARARDLAPEDFPSPPRLAAEDFDRVVEQALAALPPPVRDWLSNVAIAVEDLPADDDLRGDDPPLSPSILGVFRGAPLGEKASMDPWSHFPSSIVLYQRNLERFAASREELVEEIGVTLLHEVGHFLGLDEEELRERGLE
jgi:predicted Zn-dependent protease with MMP-like domain